MNISKLVDTVYQVGVIQQREELVSFASFIAALEIENVLEIGSFQGGTFFLLCHLAKSEGIKMSLDFWKGWQPELLADRNRMFQTWGKNIYSFDLDSHLLSTVNTISSTLGSKYLDFLFIDGDHSYTGVKMDYFMYKDFVRSGGWIGFHDINKPADGVTKEIVEVHQFWNELEGKKIEFNIGGQWGGIGMIQR